MRKFVFGVFRVSALERLKLACSATETSYSFEILEIETEALYNLVNNKGIDQTAQMHRLICNFVVCIWRKQVS